VTHDRTGRDLADILHAPHGPSAPGEPNALAAYRDALRLLLVFAADKKGKEPSKLDIDDLDAQLISAFLDDLEHQRKKPPRENLWALSPRLWFDFCICC
jgi:hypothetical protein